MASGQELAQYYVQIIPSADGIGSRIVSAIDKDDPGTKAGDSIGKKMLKAITALGIGKAITRMITSAINEGGKLEQAIGGIEQIFGEGSTATEQLKKNAQEAFSYAQVSANDYMQQVTSFSARLMQGLGGDTEATVKYADMAIRQMSDNSNTFGTDISALQNAYQGFAKANWTMLDNLRLGYGGTASEMARLVNDSGVMGKNFKATASNINSVSFDKIIDAIQVVQDNMNITGKTAMEAADTLQGSGAAMKAAWTNLIADITIGEDFSTTLKGFTESALNYGRNVLRMIGNILKELPGVIATVVQEMAPSILEKGSELLNAFIDGFSVKATAFIETGSDILVKLAQGISNGLPEFVKTATKMATEFVKTVLSNLPKILKAGAQIIGELIKGIGNAVPELLSGIKTIFSEAWNIIKNINWLQLGKDVLTAIINGIKSLFTSIQTTARDVGNSVREKIISIDWLQLGKDIISKIIQGITAMVTGIVGKVGEMASNMLDKIKNPNWEQTGKDIITNLKNGVSDKAGTVVSKTGDLVTDVKKKLNDGGWYGIGENMMNGVTNGVQGKAAALASAAKAAVAGALRGARSLLGINSPSKEFFKIGEFVDMGFAEGVLDNTKVIEDAMRGFVDATNPALDLDVLRPRYGTFGDGGSQYNYGGISINVYAQNGDSASDIADEVMDRINNQIIRQREVFG